MSEPARPGRDVFISHSTKDKPWADAACAVLEHHKIRCWIAPRDIVHGTEWGASIIEGIDASRIMVLIFSEHANASAQVRREVERAISKGLPVLPVRVEDVRPAGAMEFALGNTHWLDAFTPPMERQLETLAASVATLLGDGREIQISDPPPPPPAGPARRPVVAIVAAVLLVAAVAGLLVAFWPRGGGRTPEVAEAKRGPEPKAQPGPEPAAPAPKVTSPPAPAPIDVLVRVTNPTSMSLPEGSWHDANGGLANSPSVDHAMLRLPVDAPEEYRLDMRIESRTPFPREFQISFNYGKSRGMAVIDGFGGSISGLSWIDSRTADENPTRHAGRVFSKRGPINLSLEVRKDRVALLADGATVFRWSGPESRLTSPGPPRYGRIFLTALGGRFLIHKLTLTPLTGP